MSRQYSLAYLTIPGTTPVDQIRIASECGYDFVSLRTIPMHLPNEPLFELEKDPALFAAVKQALSDYNIKLSDIELARVREDLNVEDYEPAFEKAAELGAKDVLSSIWTKDKAFYFEKFGRICEMAAQYGLKVNLEFVTFAGVTNLAEDLEVIQTVKAPNARIMVDTLHAHRSHVSPAEIAAVDPNLFGFIHLCDGPGPIPPIEDPSFIAVAREGRLYMGEGGIDMVGYFQALPKNVISIELPNSTEMAARGAKGHAARCLETAKAFFAAHNME